MSKAKRNGGYILLDFSGVDLRISESQEITKELCDIAFKSIDLNKPIYLINLTAGQDELDNVVHCTPIPVYGIRVYYSETISYTTFNCASMEIEVGVNPETQKCYAIVVSE